MPMNFPDFQSLKNRAQARGFRQPEKNETEDLFRQSFAKYMDSVDMIEANEIRNKVGWDKWTEGQKMVMFLDKMMMGESFEKQKYKDGEQCSHPGCFAHRSHPCEGCGRIGAKGEPVTPFI